MRVVVRIFAVLLILIGVLAGGCSVMFTPSIIEFGLSVALVPMLWLTGILIGIGGIWSGIVLLREENDPPSTSPAPGPTEEDPSDTDKLQ